jgi:hypothetical protein
MLFYEFSIQIFFVYNEIAFIDFGRFEPLKDLICQIFQAWRKGDSC